MAPILGHWTLKGFGYWAVEERASGAFVGCVGLWEPSGWPEVELGYWITPQYAAARLGTRRIFKGARICLLNHWLDHPRQLH
jgi:RimJ/RimL family protein N-acetyltransferase